jgi:hypothetical protein
MSVAQETVDMFSQDPALKQAITEVALIAAEKSPYIPLDQAIYDKLTADSRKIIDGFPSYGEDEPMTAFFLSLFDIGVFDHNDNVPTPSNPVSVGEVGHLLITEHFNGLLGDN